MANQNYRIVRLFDNKFISGHFKSLLQTYGGRRCPPINFNVPAPSKTPLNYRISPRKSDLGIPSHYISPNPCARPSHPADVCVKNFQRDWLGFGCFCHFERYVGDCAWLAQICDLRLIAARERLVKSLLG